MNVTEYKLSKLDSSTFIPKDQVLNASSSTVWEPLEGDKFPT
jgi:hypothetical protein